MRRFLLSALVFAAVAVAFWLTGSGGGADDPGGRIDPDAATAADATGASGERSYGPSAALPGSGALEPRDEDESVAGEPTGTERDRSDGGREGERRRAGFDPDEALRGSGGAGGAESETLDVATSEPSSTPEPEPEPAPEPVADLEADAAEIAETLGLLPEHELQSRIDRELGNGDLSGPALDAAREQARQSVLAEAAVVEALVLERFPNATPAQRRSARGMGYTLLSTQSEAWYQEMLAQVPELLAVP